MEPIGRYVKDCGELTAQQFMGKYPNPFLLLSTASSWALQPVDRTRAPTVDRLVVGGGAGGGQVTSPLEQLYTVLEARPDEEDLRRASLGCSSRCAVVLNDTSISRLHAFLSWTEHGTYLEDHDSSAGTAVNGHLLEPTETAKLSPGDRISLGNVDLIYLPPKDFFNMVRRLFQR